MRSCKEDIRTIENGEKNLFLRRTFDDDDDGNDFTPVTLTRENLARASGALDDDNDFEDIFDSGSDSDDDY